MESVETGEDKKIDNIEVSSEADQSDETEKTLMKSIDGKSSVIQINTLYYVNENQGIVTGDQADLSNIDISSGETGKSGKEYSKDQCSKDFFLDNDEALMNWLSQHYNEFDMAFLVALAVFERVPYLWVYETAEELFKMMDNSEEKTSSIKVTTAHSIRVKNTGGKLYTGVIYNHTGKVESEFICFQKADYAKKVLICTWKQFIYFRKIFISWLMRYISTKNYSKTVRVIQAMVTLAEQDFDIFFGEIIRLLFKKKDIISDFAVVQIMSQLYKNEKYHDNIDKACIHWAKLGNPHYSLTALMVGVADHWEQTKLQLAVDTYINNLISSIRNGYNDEYRQALPAFFAIGRRKTAYFKAIVEVLYSKLKMYEGRRYINEKTDIILVFFLFLIVDDEQSNVSIGNLDENKDMVFVKMCLIKNDTAIKVRELWRALWNSKKYHQIFKQFLEKYLYQYGGCSQEKVMYLRQFLYSFASTEGDQREMDNFLRKLSFQMRRPNKVAEKVTRI